MFWLWFGFLAVGNFASVPPVVPERTNHSLEAAKVNDVSLPSIEFDDFDVVWLLPFVLAMVGPTASANHVMFPVVVFCPRKQFKLQLAIETLSFFTNV